MVSHEVAYLDFNEDAEKCAAFRLTCNIRKSFRKFECCVILHTFLSSADFFKNHFFPKNSFVNTIRVSNSLGTDQARRLVGPDLRPNCLQTLYQQTTLVGKELTVP